MFTWPITIELPEPPDTQSLVIQGACVKFVRESAHLLRFENEEHSDGILIGGSSQTETARFVPSLGDLPLLLFPRQRLLCPAEHDFDVFLTLPLCVLMGVGLEVHYTRVMEFWPPRFSRALYGPLESGTICRAVHSGVYHSLESVSAASAMDEDTAEVSQGSPYLSAPPPAILSLKVVNRTRKPLEVSKIMLPLELLSLYEHEGELLTNKLEMRLMGEYEAQLTSLGEPMPGTKPLRDLNGEPVIAAVRPMLFMHSYKQRTGLEFGF